MDIRLFMKKRSNTDRRCAKTFQHGRPQAGGQNRYIPWKLGLRTKNF